MIFSQGTNTCDFSVFVYCMPLTKVSHSRDLVKWECSLSVGYLYTENIKKNPKYVIWSQFRL